MFLELIGHNEHNAVQNTALLFFPMSHFSVYEERNTDGRRLTVSFDGSSATAHLKDRDREYTYTAEVIENDNAAATVSRAVYFACKQCVDITPPWGTITGIRPVKKAIAMLEENGSAEKTAETLRKNFLVTDAKTDLVMQVVKAEKSALEKLSDEYVSLYISIPFCPSRCKYCSFVSHSVEKAERILPQYVSLLCEELRLLADMLKSTGKRLLTVYMGGGTPTTLSAQQMDLVIKTVFDSFDMSSVLEFTVEAGRPDTVTPEKLEVLKKHSISRISINPQTMSDKTLEKIGRRHTVGQVYDAFRLARKSGFDNINMDLIAGLEGETAQDFEKTVREVTAMNPDSITVHTLSVKRAATLAKEGNALSVSGGEAAKMLEFSQSFLIENGYLPYYLYKQKNMVGNLENVGYAKEGKMCLYNVYIMGEYQTIIATGAGGVGKSVDRKSGRIERIFNYKYPYEYTDNFSKVKDNISALSVLIKGENHGETNS